MSRAKLLGIEFGRGLATYAVILVHSGDETWGVPIATTAIEFRLLFYFAVPFFLAAAFYFMTLNPEIGYSSKFWKSRFNRILIPYAIWSILFLFSRVAVFSLSAKSERLQQLLQDPLSLIFMGGASYHLYFLPLLFAGSALTLLMPFIEKKAIHKYSLSLILILSIFLNYWLNASGNSFQLGDYTAFQSLLALLPINLSDQPVLRLILVEAAWILRCLPYFLISLMLHRYANEVGSLLTKAKPVGLILLFLLCNTLGRLFLPGALSELLIAYTLLLFCFSLSTFFKRSSIENLVSSVGICSFGIYLIHPFFMNAVKVLTNRVTPEFLTSVSIYSMAFISISSFFLSWIGVYFLIKNKFVSKYLFGV